MDQINIDLSGNTEKVILIIYNSLGNVIKSEEISGERARIDLSSYQPGMYFIKADDGNSQVVRKIILE
jgi:hypothetical protein